MGRIIIFMASGALAGLMVAVDKPMVAYVMLLAYIAAVATEIAEAFTARAARKGGE
jgi:predicted benzoate:H+ symporter BenE